MGSAVAKTTSKQVRDWKGPVVLSYGFRPFFFGASFWAGVAMVMWTAMLSGYLTLPTRFDPVSWHAHEFLFGYLSAVIAGFLLTAVPNWTGRLPIVGWSLGGLALLWIAGRIAVLFSASLPLAITVITDLSFTVVFALFLGREIKSGRNWRNLVILGLLAVFTIGNALFHWSAAGGEYAANSSGFRIGLVAAIMMIAVIGGRVVPSFTRNWLVKRGADRLPSPPMQLFDKFALLMLLVALALWVVLPMHFLTGFFLLLAGGAHLLRLVRWVGCKTVDEPLVAALHVGYLFVPFGAIALGITIIANASFAMAAAQHLWMGGAIGLMTLAIMTRATLWHTGRPLTSGHGTLAIYGALLLAVLTRTAVEFWPSGTTLLYTISGVLWVVAFIGFASLYGRLLLRRPAAESVDRH